MKMSVPGDAGYEVDEFTKSKCKTCVKRGKPVCEVDPCYHKDMVACSAYELRQLPKPSPVLGETDYEKGFSRGYSAAERYLCRNEAEWLKGVKALFSRKDGSTGLIWHLNYELNTHIAALEAVASSCPKKADTWPDIPDGEGCERK